MATIKIFDQNKQETGETTLAPEVFEVAARPEILNFVVRSQMAARRSGTHNAKTRAQVSNPGNKRVQAGPGQAPIVLRFGAEALLSSALCHGIMVSRSIKRFANLQ